MYTYTARIVKVVDGDTVDLDVDLGFGITVTERFRLYGINAPESRTRDLEEKAKGLASKAYLKKEAKNISYIKTHKDKKGKFGRYLATLYTNDDKSINDELVTKGFAIYKKY